MAQPTQMQKYMGLFILAWGASFLRQVPMLRYVLYDPMIQAFNFTNTQFNDLQFWYGLVATLTYIPGGWLADRVSPRKLLAISFLSTSILGFIFSTYPSYEVCLAIHILWGVTTTLTFWAAMLRACKDMASSSEQGRFFGFLESGRGLSNVIGTTIALWVFGLVADNHLGVQWAIWIKAGGCMLAAFLVWFFFKDPVEITPSPSLLADISQTVKSPLVWALALIVFCCYTAFTVGSYMNPFLVKVCNMEATKAGFIATVWLYGGQFAAAPVSGLLADRIGRPNALVLWFGVLIAIYVLVIGLPGTPESALFTSVSFVAFYLAIYAIRGIYFAVMEDMRIPANISGSAVGLVSVLGFTPDFITFRLAGPILDQYPGAEGYKMIFTGGSVVAVVGLVVCLAVLLHIRKINKAHPLINVPS